MAGAHKSVWISYGVFEVISLKILQKRTLKRRQNYLSLFTSCHLAKNVGKNGLFESKTKRHILEGMLTSCPGAGCSKAV